MLVELAVRNLGVIAESRIPLAGGMTALTGETGAGKTMVVEALRLLGGAKADPSRVREGADEAVVEALFVAGDTEWVVRRVVPAKGRSRSYLNGELVTANELGAVTGGLIEIHGQHSQQALLDRRHQRSALDRYAGIDTAGLARCRAAVSDLESRLDGLGGDERARRRELDLLRFQVDEIATVGPVAGEDDGLAEEEDLLAGAVAYTEAAAAVPELLGSDGGAADLLARGSAMLGADGPFAEVTARLVGLREELLDALGDLRTVAETVEPDEERLAGVRARRQSLVELRHKYGETIEEVLAFAERAAADLAELEGLDERRAEVAAALERARIALGEEAARVGAERRSAAPGLAAALEGVLAELALGAVEVGILVDDTAVEDTAVEDTSVDGTALEGTQVAGAGDAVEFRISTNPGMLPGPLSKVASGGELSRVMLALRLVLSGGPPTMVFDEVDAGIGGEAALHVGAALARLAAGRQVVVVTHLPQVAAFADDQVLVEKRTDGAADRSASTSTTARALDPHERVVELSRMLSGSPNSDVARTHAEELLATAAGARSAAVGGAARVPRGGP